MDSEPAHLPDLAGDQLAARIRALLADPAHAGHPLRCALEDLFAHSEGQRERLERLVRISDGYHQIARSQTLSLSEQYDRQLRRLEKLARISDRYQNSLRELSEALKEAALQDPLTGLGNRRFLMERLREETERAQRRQASYALCILDVDHFKTINDRFGHEAGDEALLLIARAIKASLRSYDLCGRWGGEEFLILLPETALDLAFEVLERVRQGIKAAPLQMAARSSESVSVSASLGLTDFRLGESFSETLNRADRALLRAKGEGRDRVVCAPC